MNYNEIKDANDLSEFLMDGLSDTTIYHIYHDLVTHNPDRLQGAVEDMGLNPLEIMRMEITYVFYTAGWNLVFNLTGDEDGGNS